MEEKSIIPVFGIEESTAWDAVNLLVWLTARACVPAYEGGVSQHWLKSLTEVKEAGEFIEFHISYGGKLQLVALELLPCALRWAQERAELSKWKAIAAHEN